MPHGEPVPPLPLDSREVPELPHGCGSWVVVNRATGKAACETFSREVAATFAASERYEVVTVIDWLSRLSPSRA